LNAHRRFGGAKFGHAGSLVAGIGGELRLLERGDRFRVAARRTCSYHRPVRSRSHRRSGIVVLSAVVELDSVVVVLDPLLSDGGIHVLRLLHAQDRLGR
jgi:hypothetical protein